MKIGILTFHRAHNYGAELQCYALTNYISSLGYDVEVIDYFPSYFKHEYSIFPYKIFKKSTFRIKLALLADFITNAKISLEHIGDIAEKLNDQRLIQTVFCVQRRVLLRR